MPAYARRGYLRDMGDVAYFYPPAYQKAPPGSDDSLTTGSNGKPGKDGASTLTGSAPPPDSLGKDGDTYILLDTSGQALVYYGAKANGHWPVSGVSMRGADGAPAPAPIGGDGPPDSNNVGPVGQLYFDRRNAAIYQAQA